ILFDRSFLLALPLVLREIDKLARKLKSPVKGTGGTIHVELNCQSQEVVQTPPVDLFAPGVVREEQSQREHIGHFGIVHLHVWPNLTRRRFWVVRCEAVDQVLSLRSVRQDTLSIEKITPFHADLSYAAVLSKCPVM